MPRVKITELGTAADKEELRKVYSKYGSLTNVWIATNPPGFAYVFYHTFEDAEKAVEHTNGKKVCGVTVRVELSPIEDKYRQHNDRKDRFDSQDSDRGGGSYHSDFKYRQSRDNYHDNRFSSRGRGRGSGGGFRHKGGMYPGRNQHRGYSDDDYHRRRGGRGGFRAKGLPSRGYSGRGGGRDYNDGYGHRGRGRGSGRPRMEFSPSPQGRGMRRLHQGGYRDDGGGSQGRYREEFEYKRRARREYFDDGQEYWPPLSPRSPRSPHRGHHRRPDPEFSGRGGRREIRGGRRGEHDFYEAEGSRGYDEFRSHRGSKGFGRKSSFSEEERHHRGRRSGGKEDYYLKESHEYPSREEFSKGYDYHRSGHDRDYSLKEDTHSSSRYHKESFLSPKEDWDYRDRSPTSPRDRSPLHFTSASHKSSTHHSHRHYYKPSSSHIYATDDLVLHRKPRSASSTLSSASRSASPSLPSRRGSRSRSVSRSSSLRGSLDHPYSGRSRSHSRSSYSDYTPPPPPLDDNYHSPVGGSKYEPVDTYQTEDTYESRHYPVDERHVKYTPRSGSSGHSSYEEEGGQKSRSLREIKYSSKDTDRLVEIGSKDLQYEKHRDVSHREKKHHYSFSPVAERQRGISPPSRRRNSTRKKRSD